MTSTKQIFENRYEQLRPKTTKITRYRCDVCGAEFDREVEAESCSMHHIVPLAYEAMYDKQSDLPTAIEVIFPCNCQDEYHIRYERVRRAE